MTQQKCRDFAVAILNACRNSREVEMILDEPANGSVDSKDGKKPKYRQGFRLTLTSINNFGSDLNL